MPIQTAHIIDTGTVRATNTETGEMVFEWPASASPWLENGGDIPRAIPDWLSWDEEEIDPATTWAVADQPATNIAEMIDELSQRVRELERERRLWDETFEDPIAPIQPKETVKKRKTRDTMEVNAKDFNLLAFGG